MIAFGTNRGNGPEIYLVRPDGSGARSVARGFAPRLSPDAKQIAFSRGPAGPGDLYVIGVDGTHERRVAKVVASYPLAWVDGEVVYLACTADHCDLRKGTKTTARNERLSGQSFHGDQVAFERAGDVYVGDEQLTTDRGHDVNPAWSPDGKQIVFTSDRDHAGRCLYAGCGGFAPEIYVMNADGSEQLRLTASTAVDVQPAWSPGGRRIVWARVRSEQDDYELWIMNADGSCQEQLTDNDAIDWLPTWAGPAGGDRPLEC